MSAPITSGQLLAARILAGEMPKADHPQFTADEWKREAQASLDTGDFTELLWMLDYEREVDEFRERCANYEHRTGRAWDTGPLWDEEPRLPRVTAGMV